MNNVVGECAVRLELGECAVRFGECAVRSGECAVRFGECSESVQWERGLESVQ